MKKAEAFIDNQWVEVSKQDFKKHLLSKVWVRITQDGVVVDESNKPGYDMDVNPAQLSQLGLDKNGNPIN